MVNIVEVIFTLLDNKMVVPQDLVTVVPPRKTPCAIPMVKLKNGAYRLAKTPDLGGLFQVIGGVRGFLKLWRVGTGEELTGIPSNAVRKVIFRE